MIRKINTEYGKARVYLKGSGGYVAVIPGYSESITHNKALVDAIAEQGNYTAFTFSQPRKNAKDHALNRGRNVIIEVLDAVLPNDTPVHAVAHSLGSISLLRAAALHPDRFLSIILMEPPGVTSGQSLLQLARRVGRKTVRNHVSAAKSKRVGHMLRSQLSSTRVVARNPSLALKEANAARKHMLAEDIIALQDHNITIQVVTAHSDELFDIKNDLRYEQVIELKGSYSSLLDSEAGHDTFWIHPEQTAELIDVFIRRR